jgi:hypothetical protein
MKGSDLLVLALGARVGHRGERSLETCRPGSRGSAPLPIATRRAKGKGKTDVLANAVLATFVESLSVFDRASRGDLR